jgi:hypothetical protein
VNAPGIEPATRVIARLMAGFVVASRWVWNTTTMGDRSPTSSACKLRWLASYAG